MVTKAKPCWRMPCRLRRCAGWFTSLLGPATQIYNEADPASCVPWVVRQQTGVVNHGQCVRTMRIGAAQAP